MASGTPRYPPVSSPSPAFASTLPPPPSIALEPTSDGEADGPLPGPDPYPDTSDADAGAVFHFEDTTTPAQPTLSPPSSSNSPHDDALLRRSPSPTRSPQPRRPPELLPRQAWPSPLSSSPLLSPDSARFQPSSFLRPPSAMDDHVPSAEPATASGGSGPFNFQTQFISTSPVKSNIGLRRGHRYKHSSVSAQHQIFQEPPRRPPPVLPASLPLPTVREAWASMQRDQRARLYWCLCHAAVAVFVFLCATAEGGDSLALTALSHLVFFDVGSAAVCVAVDVLGNFEVWRRSTVRHPFGLRRAEVLAGFAMSIFLVFGGFDLLSHDLKDCFEALAAAAPAGGGGGPHPLLPVGAGGDFHHHHHHSHHPDGGVVAGAGGAGGAAAVAAAAAHHTRYVHPGSVDVAALAAFASTLVSAYGLGNHARIRRTLLLLDGVGAYPRGLVPWASLSLSSLSSSSSSSSPSWLALPRAVAAVLLAGLGRVGLPSFALANPFHFLTLSVSLVLLLLPLLFVAVQPWLDRLLCATIAVSMLLLGARLAVAQGLMLLMSYAGKAKAVSSHKVSASSSTPSPLTTSTTTSTATTTTPSPPSSTVAAVLDELTAELPQIARVEDAQFWQVHYGLCMANLRVRLARGCDDDSTLRQLRTRVARIIQNRLGEGYGRGNSLRWEVTVQTSVDR